MPGPASESQELYREVMAWDKRERVPGVVQPESSHLTIAMEEAWKPASLKAMPPAHYPAA
ncbi:MAG TPA: hypothetical protein VFF64_03455 [Candidatus Eremiobacteraceae bacterium]|nr:hypothetical protein [Candidatus Eremiobacteraceae bacterium]